MKYAELLIPPNGEEATVAFVTVWFSVYSIGNTGPAVEQQSGAPERPL